MNEWFLIVIAFFSKAKKKQTFPKSKTLPCSKKLFSLLKSFKQFHKTGPQRVPPCRSLPLQLKIGICTCNKKKTFWLSCFFPSSLVLLIVVGWFSIVIACFSKAKNKANLYQIKNFTLFKKTVFFIKILLTIAKNRSTKGTPLAGPYICN